MSNMDSFVVRHGTHDSERFDPIRLHASIFEACLYVRAFEGEAHDIARRVCTSVIDWLMGKTEVSSDDIRRVAERQLSVYHPEAAYMYEHRGLII